MRNFLLCTFLFITIASCSKNNATPGNKVEMYLLSSYQLVAGKCKIDTSKAVLENLPLITNDDILQYSTTSYQYRLSTGALEKVKGLVGRTPFAVTVDKKVIYYGIYMPFIMSSTCFNSITLAESLEQNSSIMMSLGYPSFQAASEIDDQRNNATLVATFRKQGKLR